MKTYKITQEQCALNIRGVCSRCGGNLEPLETVDNSGDPTFWAGCNDCCLFDNGVSREIYTIAQRLVVEHDYRRYSFYENEPGNSAEMKLYKQGQQISGACDIVKKVLHLAEEEKGKLND